MSDTQFPRGRYRLTMRAHMPKVPGGDAEMLEPGTEITYEGKPGPHMEALDDDAKVAKALAGEQRLDPHNFEPLQQGDDDERLAMKIAEAVSKAMVVAIPQIITAVMDGVVKAQQPKASVNMTPPPPPAPAAPPAPPPPAPTTPPAPPPPPADPKAGKGK